MKRQIVRSLILAVFLFGVYGLYLKLQVNVFKFDESSIFNDSEDEHHKNLAKDDEFKEAIHEQDKVVQLNIDVLPDIHENGRVAVVESTAQSNGDGVTQSIEYGVTESQESSIGEAFKNGSTLSNDNVHTHSNKDGDAELIESGFAQKVEDNDPQITKDSSVEKVEESDTHLNKDSESEFIKNSDRNLIKDDDTNGTLEISSKVIGANGNAFKPDVNKSKGIGQNVDDELESVIDDTVNKDISKTDEVKEENSNSTKLCGSEDYTINFDENFGKYIFASDDEDSDVTSNAERIKKDEEIFKTFPNYQNETKYLIYYCDIKCGGLADRLKGIIMVYMTSLLTKRRFAINMTTPCDLEQFLTPNLLDWTPPSRNYTKGKKMSILDYFERYDAFKIDYLKYDLDPISTMNYDLVLMRSNQHWVREFRTLTISPERFPELYTYHSSELFRIIYHGLFKSSKMLQKVVDDFLTGNTDGRKLACLHARMGSAQEGYVRYTQSEMMNALNFLKQYDKPDEYKIFVATDNQDIKNIAKDKFKSIIDTSGPISHIDFMSNKMSRDTKCSGFMRTMVDHVILRQCDKLIVTASGFGVTAAMLRHTSRGLHVFTEAKEVLPTTNELLREVYQWRCIWRHWGFLKHAPGVSYDLLRVPSNSGAAGNPLIG
ncbi:hypothetical protein ACF0H5_024050 [Mactra antiquata]